MFCDSDDKRWAHALYKYVYECCITNIHSHRFTLAEYETKNVKFKLKNVYCLTDTSLSLK